MEPVTKVPLPLEPIKSNQVEDRRLWVGNLDLRINDVFLSQNFSALMLSRETVLAFTLTLFLEKLRARKVDAWECSIPSASLMFRIGYQFHSKSVCFHVRVRYDLSVRWKESEKTNSLSVYWYQLLKLVQQHGTIEKFDLLFHRSGPQAGQPRGYAFVTYKTVQDAEAAKDALHNLKVGAKNIIVRWAHSVTESDIDKPKPKIDIPALAGAKKEDKRISRETAIQAIEAKLKLMNESEEEFELNKPLNGSPIIQLYQKPENPKPSTSTRYNRNHYHSNKPYNRYKPRR